MAKFDVEKIYAAKYTHDGKIDFEILGDIGQGFIRMWYTWSPDDNSPMAAQLAALYMSNPTFKVEPFVWQPPSRSELVQKLKTVLKKLKVGDYTERTISSLGEEPFPPEIAKKAAFARKMYNNFKDHPDLIPQNWTDDRYWFEE